MESIREYGAINSRKVKSITENICKTLHINLTDKFMQHSINCLFNFYVGLASTFD